MSTQMGMQLDFKALHEAYDPIKKITGIVHIGACTGEEREAYEQAGVTHVMWFEANPDVFDELCDNTDAYFFHCAKNVLLSDVDDEEVDFYVTLNKFNGRAASSSMLKLDKHLDHHPNVVVDKVIKLKTKRYDTFIDNQGWSMAHYNFLNIDVQGAELKVLRGIGNHIKFFDYIYTEINTASLYEGCVLLPELEAFMNDHGFERHETHMTEFEWGDAIFVRKELLA